MALARVLAGWGPPERKGASRYVLPVVLFSLLFILLFAGEYLTARIIDLNRDYRLLIYRVVVWDFTATLYALLEGLICILAAQVYLAMKTSGQAGVPVSGCSGRSIRSLPAVWSVVVLFLVMFVLFEYLAVNTTLRHHLGTQGILNMARFYRIVTGWCWTTFEAVAAVILIKIYLLMKSGKAALHDRA